MPIDSNVEFNALV